MVAKIAGKITKKAAKELDPEKLSTKARNAYDKSKKFIEEAVSDISIEDIDRAAGRAVDKAGKFAKKVGKKVGVTAGKVKRAGSWIKNNKGKAALGAAAVGAGVAMATKDDNKSLKSQLRRIRAKDPSERTASEKRLLRLMEE